MVFAKNNLLADEAGDILSLEAQFELARKALAGGDIKNASQLAQNVLKANERFAPGYALMAEIAEKVQNLETASRMMDLAIRFAPSEHAYVFKRGMLAFLQQDWKTCEGMLKQAVALKPDNITAWAILADSYAAQKRLEDCIATFKQARSIRDDILLDEHEGIAMLGFGALGSAEECILRGLKKDENHTNLRLQIAKIYVYTNRLDEAEGLLLEALEADEKNHEVQYFCAIWNMKRGNKEAALQHIYRAAQLKDGRDEYEMLLVSLLKEFGHLKDCETVLRRVLARDPNHKVALNTLAYILVPLGKTEEAKTLIASVLKETPDDVGLKHMRDALEGRATDAPPDAYVQELFDHYADKFDAHLIGRLGYKTPEAMHALFENTANAHNLPAKNLSLLDLGCGTGLGAEVFAGNTTYRVGVDLSQKMLDRAGAKGLYQGLHAANIVEYSAAETRQYQLVTALDVLVYIGDLAPLFSAVHHCTTQGGIFAFSVEQADHVERFELRHSGRYGHNGAYVEALASQYGFAVLAKEQSVLRKEGGKDMPGWLFILQKN